MEPLWGQGSWRAIGGCGKPIDVISEMKKQCFAWRQIEVNRRKGEGGERRVAENLMQFQNEVMTSTAHK